MLATADLYVMVCLQVSPTLSLIVLPSDYFIAVCFFFKFPIHAQQSLL